MSTPLQSSISKIRREITDHLDALENLATSKAKALETAEQSYLELERERDGLNRNQTQLAARVDELKAELANRTTAPRVITADEMKAGQWVAWESPHGGWVAGLFEESDMRDLDLFKGRTIILLDDAPTEEPEPVKVGDTINTEEQLEELPKGSILRGSNSDAFERGSGGWWIAGLVHPHPSSRAINNAPFTVLYLPEEDTQ